MPSTLASLASTESVLHKPSVSHGTLDSAANANTNANATIITSTSTMKRDSGNEELLELRPALHHASTLHHASFDANADDILVRNRAKGTTPDGYGKHESFSWDSPPGALGPQEHPSRIQSTPSPKGNSHTSPSYSSPESGPDLPANLENGTLSLRHTQTWSGSTSFEDLAHLRRSLSASSSIARGITRRTVDVSVLGQRESVPHQTKPESTSAPQRLAPALKKSYSDDKPTKRVHHVENIQKTDSPSQPCKIGLKDRRKLGRVDSLKLTIPKDLTTLPSRYRSPADEYAHLAGMVAPRRTSPKTPWTGSSNQDYVDDDDAPVTVPLEIEGHLNLFAEKQRQNVLPLEVTPGSSRSSPLMPTVRRIRDRCYTPQPRLHKSRSVATSESSLAHTPDQAASPSIPSAVVTLPTGAQEPTKRFRRWRWGGPWTSVDNTPVESPTHPVDHRFVFPRFIRPKKSKIHSPTADFQEGMAILDQRAPTSFPDQYRETISNMAVPPTFIPPGLQRVPTPPEYDNKVNIQGQLADFFFDIHDGTNPQRQSSKGPRGIWNSDNLLMSQQSALTNSSSSSEDTPPPITPFNAPTLFAAPSTPLSLDNAPANADWFRVQLSPSQRQKSDLWTPEERSKCEWLTPEHLPTSPLCPLHPKYVGPAKGNCVFHRRVAQEEETDIPAKKASIKVGKESRKNSKRDEGKRKGSRESNSSGRSGRLFGEKVHAPKGGFGVKKRLVRLSNI